MNNKTRIADLPVQDIIEPSTLLRLVDRGSLDYMVMMNSIKEYGFLNSISVRPSKKYEDKYELMDGLYRYSIARDLELATIPCIIKDVKDDVEMMMLQIQANAIRPETRPCEYADHLDRILRADTEMTLVELAGRLKMSVEWIQSTLSLRSLTPEIQKSLDRGEIPVKSARLLAKLPKPWQEKLKQHAQLYPYSEFSPIARAALKEYRECIRRGRMKEFYSVQFQPHPYYQALRVAIHEMKNCEEGAITLATEHLTPLEAWKRALEWVLHMDPKGVEAQERVAKSKQDKMAQDIKRRKKDRERIKEVEKLDN